jgi:protein tyrosine phosphatase (PTP) superfamily phosphohydrolase (DUF442 family)
MTPSFRKTVRQVRPWLILALAVWPAVWHVLDFPEDRDDEYPAVQRPTFSQLPPPAYRLAEPGDTIDRIAIYTSSLAIVLSITGWVASRKRPELWPTALGISLAVFWYGANPGPTFDGWHGLGWRAMLQPDTPPLLRAALAAAALGLAGISARPLIARWPHWGELWQRARQRQAALLLVVALVLGLFRQVEIPGIEPAGYWPRWSLVWSLIAWNLALVRLFPPLGVRTWLGRAGLGVLGTAAWFALVVAGIGLTWYHRPLARLRTVVPGKIYISAMPTPRGLEVAYGRHPFKTIINLFPEDTPLTSPLYPAERAFARAHGIHYIVSPSDVASSDAFLDETLRLAQDPSAWPILVHCHACMDRTPAWMGIYRFVVEGRPLDDIFREIEAHRGYRPKASVFLLYNRVLPQRAPERYVRDPAAALVRRSTAGTYDPFQDEVRAERERRRANPAGAPRVTGQTAERSDTGVVAQ